MPPPPHSKPENMLKRAQELMGVGQPQQALTILHEHLTSKRTRGSPISSLEPLVLLFVELCVDLKKGKSAKDGLYQYKNISQNANTQTIQLVFKRFIELAEKKVSEAQAKADEILASTVSENDESTKGVEDLEATETPESILLSTVSGEQSKDRTDRAIVTPWLKFLWETYRTVLDILKNNSRLEPMYQSTAHQAFVFCSKYQRKTEFRRLCELLRNHLQNAAKFSSQMHAINLNDADTLQRHLDTRFQQLNVAVELELWQEAFRSVEDIHTLLNLSKRPPKPVMMANYFEKLTRIFLVSENYLFHAAAWNKYYNLLRQSASQLAQGGSKKDHPTITEDEKVRASSFVLLSALSIPVISTSRSRGALVDVDEARKSKNSRLQGLLGMTPQQGLTRAWLFQEAVKKDLIKSCRPEIRELYNILEVEFHPLSICKRISPILSKIGTDEEMAQYIHPLQQVILTRLFQQLSQVYDSVRMDFVLDLAQFPEPFKVDRATIEKFIMNGCKKGDLAIRINHATGVLTFDSDIFSSAKALHPGSTSGSADSESGIMPQLQSTPAEITRSLVPRLASGLYITVQFIDPTFNEARVKAAEAAQKRALAGLAQESLDILSRKKKIDSMKEANSRSLAQQKKESETQKRIKQQEAQAAEQQRLQYEQKERDRRRIEIERQKVQQEEAQKALEELKRGTKGIDLAEIDVGALDSAQIRSIKIRALEKEKSELHDKLRTTGRRIDHIERAFRQEEIKHLPEDYAAQKELDLKAYEDAKDETLTAAKVKHTEDVALKHRLTRLVPIYNMFRDEIYQSRKADFEKRNKKAQQELESQMEARRRERRETKLREKREREEKERKEREEEERKAAEEEEREQQQAERRRRMAEEKARRDEENKKLDEVAARQKAAEERAAAKLAAKRAGEPAPAAAASGGRPRIQLAPRTAPVAAEPWRSSSSNRGAAPEESAAPRRTGAYVPPAARGGDRPSERVRPTERRDERSIDPPTQRRVASPFEARDASPLPPAAPTKGRYVPGAFKRAKETKE
ncbi:putative eukaryotic translation initiation factor 3 subunit EifCa [Microthyrium microscopicum]|uniref:Eukaryotic translation initiation factor 3 subunit A n=1 Tax=Microthyrium microscopicum TaxID=703497 RepID=A0A6A6URK3_9PEZI|nr:putative eukaryotic translation initiation factor 3 subunit EifCa [Microthyrium microscopicum]